MSKKDKKKVELPRIRLGGIYKDAISGWVGVAASMHIYLNGCVRYELSGADKDGKPIGYIFDAEQIVTIDDEPVETVSTHGGPRDSDTIDQRAVEA